MEPSVTAVIATRDRPEMVRQAIASVWEQDYPGPVEIVVVFDQSEPDSTLARVQGDRRVRVITNSRSEGLAGARNSGITHSSGEFVAFCDDDDYWLPGKLRAQVEALDRHPEAPLATCGVTVEYDGARFERVLDLELIDFDELLRDRHTELHPSTFVFRRRLLEDRVGLVDEQVPGGFGEDYELLLRTARTYPVVSVNAPLAVIRWGTQSFFFRRWETMAGGLTWLLEQYPEFARSRRGSARIRGQVAFAHAAMGHRRDALRWAGRAIRSRPVEPRGWLALLVAFRALSPNRVMEWLHHRGRGI